MAASVIVLLHLFLFLWELQAHHLIKIEQVLDQVESLVQDLANQAVLNQQNTCESLANCTADKCLRRTCWPQSRAELKSLTCTDVVPELGSCSNSCNKLRISASESYVRIPPLASLESDYELRNSLCAQKPLNAKLQQGWKVSSELSNGWFYFGGAEGYLITFPGRDYQSHESCNEYDARIRPWFINALAVAKSLYVLLDNSPSMDSNIGSLFQKSCPEVGKNIVRELLKTLVSGDEVAVAKISGYNQWIGKSVSVNLENEVDMSFKMPEIKDLQEAVRKTIADGAQANFQQALSGALDFFNSTNSNSTLKVVMILTDWTFAKNLNVTELDKIFQQLNQEKVVVFLYGIGLEDSTSDVKLQEMSSRLNMRYEPVNDPDNPLSRIQSYFDYIAWNRFTSVNKAPLWVPLHADDAGLGDITTAIFPAFDASQRLIGVAALDLNLKTSDLVSEVGSSALNAAITNRTRQPSTSIEASPLNQVVEQSIDCMVQTGLTPVCPRQDSDTPLSSFICCGESCNKKHSKKFINLVIIVGSAGGALLALVLAFLLCRRARNRNRNRRTLAKVEQIRATFSSQPVIVHSVLDEPVVKL